MKKDSTIYERIFRDLESRIKTGALLPGDKLPSKRALAAAEGVSLNTVTAAYELAAKKGLIHTAERVGYFVADGESKRKYKGNPWSKPDVRRYVFSINSSGISTMTKKFIRARHDAEYDINGRLMRSKEYTGNALLRERICEYLYKTRRIVCTSEQIITMSGINEAASICARLLGGEAVYGFEDPTEKKLEFAIADNRKTVLIPSGIGGLDINALYSSGADVFFCMPEKQYPLGYKLNGQTRGKLLRWCADGRYIIEYGLCSEFSFDTPQPSLYELDKSGSVIYIGSFDKVTVPGMTISFIVLPERLVPVFKEKLWYHHSNVSEYDSLVLSEFIANGGIYSNIRRLKRAYEKKCAAALEEFRKLPFYDRLTFTGENNAHFFSISVDTNRSGGELMALAAACDVKLLPVSCFSFIHDTSSRIFAFGYGGLTEPELRDGIRLIGGAWDGQL